MNLFVYYREYMYVYLFIYHKYINYREYMHVYLFVYFREYIKNTIIKNIEFCYRKVNIFDNYNDNIDQFIKNQEHINKFNEIKYKDKIFASILPLIEI